jgi:hypothetical protein
LESARAPETLAGLLMWGVRGQVNGLARVGVAGALAGDEVARCATMPQAHESYALAPALHGRAEGQEEAQSRL